MVWQGDLHISGPWNSIHPPSFPPRYHPLDEYRKSGWHLSQRLCHPWEGPQGLGQRGFSNGQGAGWGGLTGWGADWEMTWFRFLGLCLKSWNVQIPWIVTILFFTDCHLGYSIPPVEILPRLISDAIGKLKCQLYHSWCVWLAGTYRRVWDAQGMLETMSKNKESWNDERTFNKQQELRSNWCKLISA